MGEASETFDDVVMLSRISEQVIIAERGEELHRPFLIRKMFAVFERHVEEAAFRRLKLIVEAPVDGLPGNRERQMVGRELVGVGPKHVAWKLVEQDDAREGSQRIVEEAFGRELALQFPEREEAFADVFVEDGIGLPPLLRLQTEPETQNVSPPI